MPSSKAAQLAAQALGRLYGPAVTVRYYDLDNPAVREQQRDVLASAEDERWPLPLVLLDGRPLPLKRLHPLLIVAAVAEELARRGR